MKQYLVAATSLIALFATVAYAANVVTSFTPGTNLTYTPGTGVLDATGGGGLTVGTSAITSGTNGRFLYDSSGVLGEAIIGSGLSFTAGTLTATGGGATTGFGVDGGTTAQSVTGTTVIANATRLVKIATGWATGTLTLPAITAVSSDTGICVDDGGNFINPTHTLSIASNAADSISGGATPSTIGPYTTVGTSICFRVTAAHNWAVESGASLSASSAPANQFANGVGINGLSYAQPAVTNLSGLGTGVATFLGTPTGANLTTALSSGGGTTNFLRADGAFAAPAGGGTVTNGANLTDKAIVVGSGGTTGVATLASLGTSGQVLTSNGAGVLPTFQTGGGGGITCADSGFTVISGSNCAKTICVNAGGTGGCIAPTTDIAWTGLVGDNYQLRCANYTPSTGTPVLYYQEGTGGTPTYTTANYSWVHVVTQVSGTTALGSSPSDSGFPIHDSTSLYHTVVEITGLTKAINHALTKNSFVVAAGNNFYANGGGVQSSSTLAVTAFRLHIASGNIATISCEARAL